MNLNFLKILQDSISQNSGRNAFCINDIFYSYSDLSERIKSISLTLGRTKIHNDRVGIICENNLETYASIIACWLNGYAFVPILRINPIERNFAILEEAKIKIIINSNSLLDSFYTKNFEVLDINEQVEGLNSGITFQNINHDAEAYILFTSGSTGKPKGVPITFGNLDSFLGAFSNTDFSIDKEDRCLQMFELTFDVSISSFLTGLISGACIYTVSDNSHKYIDVFRLINKYKLTNIQIVPSVLKLGKSLYKRVDFSSLKSCILTGEATSLDVLEKFIVSVPHVSIYNYYGPTECTIYCSFSKIINGNIKSHNGLVSIGKPFNNTIFRLLRENGTFANQDEKGELWVNSPQLTKGYIDNELNSNCFREIESEVYYKTGDLCLKDKDGDYLYCGRVDNQVQIQGFRVELGEIEFKAKEILGFNCVALDFRNTNNFDEIVLILETENHFSSDKIIEVLSENLPYYMSPNKIESLPIFPLTISGKTDRNEIRKILDYQNEFGV